ncbi:MAG: hypothetical protein M3N41_14430 [Acidobacteriota bacterium]|nr:hypothetical protein [Acidobacteriota bacterium]
MIKKIACMALLSALSAVAATWTGMISDSACGMSHAKMLAADKKLKTDRDCTLACIKAGSKYVFVSDGKVYSISNQKLAALKVHAGETVQLTGTMKGDTIKVSKIAAK